MRFNPYVLLSVLLSLPFAAPFAKADETIPFSHFGYRHHEMHSLGIIPEMIEAMGGCCDGGKGGECRVTTTIAMQSVEIDGMWCPITLGSTKVRTDIELPNDVEAIACAARSETTSGKRRCPTIYCLTAKVGS